ncbi:nucleolar protein [Microbotryomycetes sp. JL201]|nr:nucleolar protein [Microbotryomycetes sp. JL201]
MPKQTAASASSPSQKRVRIESAGAASSGARRRSLSTAKNASTNDANDDENAAKSAPSSKDTQKSNKSKMGVELMDLRDKARDLGKVEKFKSKDSPKPAKSALKKRKNDAEDDQEEDHDRAAAADGGDHDDDEDEGSDSDDDDDDLDFLKGFEESDDEDDGQDSSDEDDDDDDNRAAGEGGKVKPKFDAKDLPQVKGKESAVQAKLEKKEAKADKKKKAQTGTVYLGRIPHGFYEEEMRSYFSQFGQVTRLRLSRNKKTGRSKHYAFIEFAYESVAKIVQETMDNYLLAGHILVCKVVPNDQIHPKMWIGANRKYRPVPKARQDRVKRIAPKTDEQKDKIKARLLKKEEQKRKQLAELGIEYDFAGYAGKATVDGAEKGQVEPENGKKSAKGKVVGKVKEQATGTKRVNQPAKKRARKST